LAWKALYIILSLAVFFSTTGFTVGHHYCQNELAGTTIFGIAGGCHKSTHKACNERNHCSGKKESGKKSCCHNDSQYVKQDLPKQVHFTGIDFLKKPALIAAVFAVITLQISATDDILPTFQIYKPPIVCDDFQSLLQTFRL
jgi:hypothetical protein